MRFTFHKMHGLGNDFVVIDGRGTGFVLNDHDARALADRHTGIGCDQVILLESSTVADIGMKIFNADGGEVEACGNASRAVALLLKHASTIETRGGVISVAPGVNGITVDMGMPRFEWDAIPLAYPLDTAAMPMAWEGWSTPAMVNVGNPHAIFFVDDCDTVDLEHIGPVIEHDPVFPNRVNVNVATVTSPSTVRLRVWERGAGLTRACGTGASATAVAAIRARRATSPVVVSLPGGDLTIGWTPGGTITMTGPAKHVFSGEAELADFG